MRKILKLWSRTIVELRKQSLTGHSSMNLDCRTPENTGDNGDPVQEVSEENNNSNWVGAHSCAILAKNVAAFCPCPKNLPKAKLKSNRLISLVEAISRKHEIRRMVIFGTPDADLQRKRLLEEKQVRNVQF